MTELRRPVRTKNGTPLKCGIKRGDVAADEEAKVYVQVRKVLREGDEWVVTLEEVGEWAVQKPAVWDCVIPKEVVTKILNGPRPEHIKWPNPCPVKHGQVVLLSDNDVEVTIGQPVPTKGEDGFTTKIRIADFRATSFLRKSPPSAGNTAMEDLSPSEIRKAALESAYTGVTDLALDHGEFDEGPPLEWVDTAAPVRDIRRQEARTQEEARRVEKSVQGKLRGVLKGLSPEASLVLLAVIERKIREVQYIREAA